MSWLLDTVAPFLPGRSAISRLGHHSSLPDARRFTADAGALRRVVEAISSVGSHPLGFRATGTPEEHQVAELVAAEMRSIGLADVRFEYVPVHAWRFRGASVAVDGAAPIDCSSLAGARGTRGQGVRGDLVMVGDGRRERLDRLDLNGKIALLDWRSPATGIGEIGLELSGRGARAIVAVCRDGASRFQGPDALGTGVARWYDGAPPIVIPRARDGEALIDRCRAGTVRATVTATAEIDRRARGRNVVGVLGNDRPGAPIVVGAHHDGWFSGAFDNASGVAAMLALARALTDAGWEPSRPVWFVSHTGEEYALLDHDAPWCFGAWHQVTVAHPRWGSTVPFYLDIEASGRPEFPLLVIAPRELRRFASRWCRRAERDGLLPTGWRFADPVTGTHQWPFQLRGVPGVSIFNWHTRFARTDYHTTNDTADRLDYDYLAGLTRLHAALLIDADRDPDAMLDFAARARHVKRVAARAGAAGLDAAADGYARAAARRGFTRLARSGFALDDQDVIGYLHEQAVADAQRLTAALERFDRGDHAGAARSAAAVGTNSGQPWLSHQTWRTAERRRLRSAGSWSLKSHQTASPDLWAEIASLRGEPGSRAPGPWLRRSLEAHRARCERESGRRVAMLARALRPG